MAPDDARHPIFRPLAGGGSLGNATFSRIAQVKPGVTAQTLARYSDGSAALVDEAAGQGRVVLLASDLNNSWNDLPVQPAFVPFLHETLRYLATDRGGRNDYIVGELPGNLGAAPGAVTLSDGRRVAVNVDPRESDPSAMSADAFSRAIARLNVRSLTEAATAARGREDSQRLWQYGLLLMILSLAAESVIGRRLA